MTIRELIEQYRTTRTEFLQVLEDVGATGQPEGYDLSGLDRYSMQRLNSIRENMTRKGIRVLLQEEFSKAYRQVLDHINMRIAQSSQDEINFYASQDLSTRERQVL